MDFVCALISPVVEIMKGSCTTVVRQIGYIKNLERNFKRLNEKAGDLSSRKNDITREIDSQRTSKMPTDECQNWLKKVDEILKEVNAIEDENSKGDKRCLRQWCLNVGSSWKVGRRIVVTTDAIVDLCEKSKFVGAVVVDAMPQIVEAKPVLTIEEGTSTERTLQKILNNVRDPRKHKIGIWGMGGVGKTTVMKLLNNLEEIKQMFEIVIWVTISKDYRTRELQNVIARRLSLKLSYNDSDERVASIEMQRQLIICS